MAKTRGAQCCVFGCEKRKKFGENKDCSDSEGSDDEESLLKRKFPRSFHRYVS